MTHLPPGTPRYGSDVLSTDWRAPKRGRAVDHPAELGAVVEEVMTDFCGEIIAVDRDLHTVTLEDRRNRRRTFPLGPGFLHEGRPVVLTAPVRRLAPPQPRRTASGSVAVNGGRARVARQSRIAEDIARSPLGQHVLITGHPFVDVWAAVKPARLGLTRWPDVPRDVEWKRGVCEHLGWPHRDQTDIARAWQHILSRVASYHDLEPALLGRVEELIDFVSTAP